MNNRSQLFRAAVALGIWGFLILALSPLARGAEMDNYCSTPPFLSNVVPPNVLIILDNSGSMSEDAYPGSFNPSQFVSGHYYGYFDPAQNYVYNGSRWVVTTADFSTATIANPIASGNLLNWATMERIEVAKRLLIGGKASPRSPSAGVTVKLNYETSGSFHNDFDNTASPGLIAPFVGNYRYSRSGNSLSVTPLSGGTNTYATYPTGNISAPAAWTVTGAASAWAAVNELVADGNTTTIQNKTSTAPVILDYNYTGPTTGSISQVAIKVVAKKSSSTQMRIQGVLQSAGSNYASSTAALTTSYSTYTFVWTTNPATGAAWQWNEIKSNGSGALNGFGVQAFTTPTSSNYPTVTQVYLQITTSTPSGGPYTLVVDQGMVKAEGLIDHLSAGARFGLMYYNYGCGIECGTSGGKNDGGHIDTYIDFGSPVNMVTSIQNASAQTWTPLAESLYEAIGYFRQDNPYYSNTPADYQVGPNYDPYYFQYSKLSGSGLPDQYVPCAKSFVLLLTDGEATMDTNIPVSLRDYDADSKDPAGTSSNYYATDYLDDVALWGRTVDQRTGAKDLKGIQNVYFYDVFLFGKGSSLLKDAAINGGFNDLNGDGKPGPDLKEYLRDSNEDGVITASDLPLTYFEGDDGYELEASLTDAIASILKRAASGTAVSVLTTSSRGVGSLVQAYFLPSKQEGSREVLWTGYAQNLWLDPQENLREDTVNDESLMLDKDNVLKLFFDQTTSETKAATFTTDAEGSGGTLNSCSSPVIKQFSDVTYLWEAGKKLALKNPSTRTLFTAKNVIRGNAMAYSFSETPYPEFKTTMNATLKNELNPPDDNVIRYIRGECLETGVTDDTACGATANTTYRDRRISVTGGGSNGNVWKLGDIISSTPKVLATTALNSYLIDYADSTYFDYFTSPTYKQRSAMAFMGANDGMVHAFRVGYLKDTGLSAGVKALFKNFYSSNDTDHGLTGEEVWGYIPFNALPYLKHLANPNYCHLYYSDLSVRLVDASVGSASALSTDTRDVNSWRTILIGGMRFGGGCSGGTPTPPAPVAPTTSLNGYSSYFAIDVTDPEKPVPIWEFSDADLGYASTYPAIVRTGGRNQNGNWYVAIGSGSTQLPKTNVDMNRTTPGYVYLLNLKTGALAQKIQLDHNGIVGDLLAIDADKDYVSEKIYFGTAYNSLGWKGKIASIAVPNQDLSSGWTPIVTYLFTDNYPFTAEPDAALDTNGDVWVYEGSGKYYSNLDVDASQQIFLAFKDNPRVITYPLTLASGLDDRTTFQTTGTVSATSQACLYDSSSNSFKMQTYVTAITPTSSTPTDSVKGWFLSLPKSATSQRVISRPLAVGGLVDFLAYQPSADPCSFGGNSFLYAVGYTTGVMPPNVPIVDPNVTNKQTTGTVTLQPDPLPPGPPPTGEAIIVKGETLNKKIQVGTGVIVEAKNETPYKVVSRFIHWLKK